MLLSVTSRCSRQQMLKGLDKLPKLSPMTTRLLARLAQRQCNVQELALMIENDPLLSAQLLRMANSAAFGYMVLQYQSASSTWLATEYRVDNTVRDTCTVQASGQMTCASYGYLP